MTTFVVERILSIYKVSKILKGMSQSGENNINKDNKIPRVISRKIRKVMTMNNNTELYRGEHLWMNNIIGILVSPS